MLLNASSLNHDARKDAFEIEFLLAHISDLLRPRSLSLDGDSPAIAGLVELRKDMFEVRLPLANQDLFAELHGIGGEESVFCVDASHIGRKHIDGVCRIRLSVEDQIRRVEA